MKNSEKIIIHLCCSEFGSDTKDYRDAGYDVRMITEKVDVRGYEPPANVYGVFANPPCTVFSKAGWQIKKVDRKFNEGMELVKACLNIIWKIQEKGMPLKFWALENPQGYLSAFLGKPAFTYQPWEFGDDTALATKRECLWGYFNPPIKPNIRRTVPNVLSTKHGRPQALFPDKSTIGNKAWSKLTSDERSIASPQFTKAFFLANP
jgi:hypothetical protein